jgi:ornithine--oxo-acid transaminase
MTLAKSSPSFKSPHSNTPRDYELTYGRINKILVQVAGHANPTVKLLPALVITESDCEWIERAFDAVIADSHRVPGAVWSLGKTLADHAIKAYATK